MSWAGAAGGGGGGVCTVRSSLWRDFGNLYSEVWVMVTSDPPVNRQADTTENIIFPQLRWRAVNMDIVNS